MRKVDLKMGVKRYLVIFLVFVFASGISAQDKAGINGIVIDKLSGKAISNADIVLEPGNIGAVTDKTGSPPPGIPFSGTH